jgi:hypothetical protein
MGAQRHADADLTRALLHHVGHHSVQANRRKHQTISPSQLRRWKSMSRLSGPGLSGFLSFGEDGHGSSPAEPALSGWWVAPDPRSGSAVQILERLRDIFIKFDKIRFFLTFFAFRELSGGGRRGSF